MECVAGKSSMWFLRVYLLPRDINRCLLQCRRSARTYCFGALSNHGSINTYQVQGYIRTNRSSRSLLFHIAHSLRRLLRSMYVYIRTCCFGIFFVDAAYERWIESPLGSILTLLVCCVTCFTFAHHVCMYRRNEAGAYNVFQYIQYTLLYLVDDGSCLIFSTTVVVPVGGSWFKLVSSLVAVLRYSYGYYYKRTTAVRLLPYTHAVQDQRQAGEIKSGDAG